MDTESLGQEVAHPILPWGAREGLCCETFCLNEKGSKISARSYRLSIGVNLFEPCCELDVKGIIIKQKKFKKCNRHYILIWKFRI